MTASSAASFEPASSVEGRDDDELPAGSLREHRRGVLGDPSGRGTVGAEEDSLKHEQIVHVPLSYQTGCQTIR